MPVRSFPDPRKATTDGILAIGGDLHAETLLLAYSMGVFPWPTRASDGSWVLAWFSPPERAVLDFDQIHIPKSLARAKRKSSLVFTVNRAFSEVIHSCARREETWISAEMIDAYLELHRLGFAHSVEAWAKDQIVGGVYGVEIEGAFSGESMFHLEPNASKFALLHLVEKLRTRGFSWIDIQVMTPHLEALGAKLIPRDEFLERLARAQDRGQKQSAILPWA